MKKTCFEHTRMSNVGTHGFYLPFFLTAFFSFLLVYQPFLHHPYLYYKLTGKKKCLRNHCLTTNYNLIDFTLCQSHWSWPLKLEICGKVCLHLSYFVLMLCKNTLLDSMQQRNATGRTKAPLNLLYFCLKQRAIIKQNGSRVRYY